MPLPTISICLPNLNNRPFLEERINSIQKQTFDDWELIIFDSYSDDGAWEYLQEVALNDPRIVAQQAPRGLYENWNRCIGAAKGQYIYFATSDDSMLPDCLSQMVEQLNLHPECDICHTPLIYTDQYGFETDPDAWRKLPIATCLGDLCDRPHIRVAPYDGILHLAVNTVYTSITQILIRRTLFKKSGLFRSDFGSAGDFEWGLRAGFLANVVYLPKKLATWRKHPTQSTKQSYDSAHMLNNIRMVTAAMQSSHLRETVVSLGLSKAEATYFYRITLNVIAINERKSIAGKLLWLVQYLLKDPEVIFDYVISKMGRKSQFGDASVFVGRLLLRYNIQKCIRTLV